MTVYLVIDREKPFGDWHIQQGFAIKSRAIDYMAILAKVHNDDQDEDCTQFKKTSSERWENDHQYLAIEEIQII